VSVHLEDYLLYHPSLVEKPISDSVSPQLQKTVRKLACVTFTDPATPYKPKLSFQHNCYVVSVANIINCGMK